jgi:hypothetical protein
MQIIFVVLLPCLLYLYPSWVYCSAGFWYVLGSPRDATLFPDPQPYFCNHWHITQLYKYQNWKRSCKIASVALYLGALFDVIAIGAATASDSYKPVEVWCAQTLSAVKFCPILDVLDAPCLTAAERWTYVAETDVPARSNGPAVALSALSFLLYLGAGTMYGFHKHFCKAVRVFFVCVRCRRLKPC